MGPVGLAVWAVLGTAVGGIAWGISQYTSDDSDKVKVDKYDDDDRDLNRYGWNAKETNTENNSESLSSKVTALGRTVWGISQYISNDSDKVKVDKYDDDDDDLDRYGWNAKETNTENNPESLSSKVTAFAFEAAPDHATESPISKNSKILPDTTSPVKLVYNADDDCYIWNAITEDQTERHSSSSNVTASVFEAAPDHATESPISKNSKILRVTTSPRSNTLKIMSYNICSREEYPIYERMDAIGALIQLHSPHVICFQECTLQIYTILQSSSWWDHYHCSISEEEATDSERKHFCILLSKDTLTEIINTTLGFSKMERLSVAKIKLGTRESLVVASGHLKSPRPDPNDPNSQNHKFKKERMLQANDAINILKKHPNVILCGDMNWNEKTDGNFPLPAGWIDAWNELKGEEQGYTFDTQTNKMLNGHWPHLRERLNRIFYNLKGKGFKVDDIDIIGKEAISDVTFKVKKKTLPVLPSDHYGLLLTFSVPS